MEKCNHMIWELYAEYEDGTIIDETRPYNEYDTESTQKYELEWELIEDNYYSFGECKKCVVTLVYE